MTSWHSVAKIGDIPPGEGRSFPVDGKLIAVFQMDDQHFAINDLCPHMGASLAEGYLEEGAVSCPWHAWRFCVQDGTWLDNPKASVKTETYPVRIEGNDIQIQICSDSPSSAEIENKCSSPDRKCTPET